MNLLDCVVITGAGQGIGKAAAFELARKKIHVVCLSRSENAANVAAEISAAGGSAESMVADIGKLEETKNRMAKWVADKKFKRIGLVLAAGILGAQNFENLDEWEECYRINVLGNLAVYAGLRARLLENKFGRIVCFAGGGAAYAFPLFPAYSASKAAMVRTAENMQEDLNGKGDFAVVCLAPGANDTNMLKLVRAAGAKVMTTVDIAEPVGFVREFLSAEHCGFKGAFVHVRDDWKNFLTEGKNQDDKKWKLRRTE